MLSAIAARKAAQAAKLTTQPRPPPSTSKTIALVEHDSDSEQLKAILRPQKSKRKSAEAASSETLAARKKRRKKTVKKAEMTQSRYYVPNNGDYSQRAGSSLSGASESDEDDLGEVRFVDGDAEDIVSSQQAQKPQRAWSPSNPPPDSSDDELNVGDTLAPVSHSPRAQDAGYQFTQALSFSPRPNKNVFYLDGGDTGFLSGRKGTIIALEEGETLALLGVYSMTVLRGIVSFMGVDLHASTSNSRTVFAPKCSPVPIIKALAFDKSTSFTLPDSIARTVRRESSILFIEDVSTGIEGLGRMCKTFEGVFEAGSLGENVLSLSGVKLITSITRSLQLFQLPQTWQNAFASLSSFDKDDSQIPQALTLLVRGQKRTGKSTLARTTVNRLLNQYRRIAFIECDIGQTEFTPPGLVSLHVIDRALFGAPFTHPLLPYASHFIGSLSPKNDPAHYLSAVAALFQTYKLEVQYPAPEDGPYESDFDDGRIVDIVPLVVNTMGWTKGLGADLARQIEEVVQPTHVFSLQFSSLSTGTSYAMEVISSTAGTSYSSGDQPQIFDVESISPGAQSARYSAGEWRTLSLMSYFHSVPSPAQYDLLPPLVQLAMHDDPDSTGLLCTWDCRLPLVAQVPFTVSPIDAFDNIALVGAGTEDVVPSELPRVLNGALVALVSCQPDFIESSQSAQYSKLPYIQGTPPPDPSTSNCVGLALVRGVSPSLLTPSQLLHPSLENDLLQVLTPLPPRLIAASTARCLVKGEIELPVWGMLDYRDLEADGARAREVDGVPYLQWSKSDAIGAERRRVRRNLMRKGQM